jgi:hypothetical protein
MTSRTTEGFWKLYETLPQQTQSRAKAAYQRFQQDPHHPGLQFKKVHETQPIYSARISRDYRAVGVKDENEIIWFWIGSHSDYDNLLSQL